MRIRPGIPSDLEVLTQLCSALWPNEPAAEHETHAALILAGMPASTLPLVLFVAEVDGSVVGFIEVGMRSHADGCDGRRSVAFIEGWYVKPQYQRCAVGRALMAAAEGWARSQGARELASDTWIDNEPSQRAHEALGFEIVDRCVNFRKSLPLRTTKLPLLSQMGYFHLTESHPRVRGRRNSNDHRHSFQMGAAVRAGPRA